MGHRSVRATIAIVVACCAIVAGAVAQSRSSRGTIPAGSVQVTVMTKQSDTVPIPVAARAGDQFTITLDSNHTTGYGWQLSGKPNAKIVQSLKNAYNEPAQPMPGRGGTETWTFKAVGKGTTSITLVYVRPWEKNVAPAKTQKLSVTVQ